MKRSSLLIAVALVLVAGAAQAVAQQVQAQHRGHDRQPRPQREQRGLEHLRLRFGEHAAPARPRRLRAQPQVAERGLGQDGGGEGDGGQIGRAHV
mgnify:CR=1 FL=1